MDVAVLQVSVLHQELCHPATLPATSVSIRVLQPRFVHQPVQIIHIHGVMDHTADVLMYPVPDLIL